MIWHKLIVYMHPLLNFFLIFYVVPFLSFSLYFLVLHHQVHPLLHSEWLSHSEEVYDQIPEESLHDVTVVF